MAKNDQSIGALWRKISERNQKEYWTGEIQIPGCDKCKTLVFSNFKSRDTHPDFRIYLQEREYNSAQGQRQYQPPAPRRTPAAPGPADTESAFDIGPVKEEFDQMLEEKEKIDLNDIPF